jgi:flagellar biosynthesis protein FlhB
MNRNERTWLILAIVIVVAILAALWATSLIWFPSFLGEPWEPREHHLPPPENIAEDIEFFYTVETVVSTVNVTLSIFLLLTYISIYLKTKSEFTIGLIIFSMVFFLNAFASNPFVIWVFGFRPVGLGPFALLPDLFTFGALAVLLYLSVKY